MNKQAADEKGINLEKRETEHFRADSILPEEERITMFIYGFEEEVQL